MGSDNIGALFVGQPADMAARVEGTLGVTIFFAADYTLETGNVWTVEAGFAQVLPKVGMFTPGRATSFIAA